MGTDVQVAGVPQRIWPAPQQPFWSQMDPGSQHRFGPFVGWQSC